MAAVIDMYATNAYYSAPTTEQVAPFKPPRSPIFLKTGETLEQEKKSISAKVDTSHALSDRASQFAQLGVTEVRAQALEVTNYSSAERRQRQSVTDESLVKDLSNQRMKILATKFAGVTSKELSARLEILNARMERKLPRVSSSQVAQLESSADFLASIDSMRANLKMRKQD